MHKVRHLILSSRRSSLIACHNRYWGKRDTKLILPTNSSLSVTLDQDHLRSTTTSRADPSFDKDRLWLNGKEESIDAGGRLATCITEMKRLRAAVEAQNSSAPKVRASMFSFFSHLTSLPSHSYPHSRCTLLLVTTSPQQPALRPQPLASPPL